MNYKNDFQKLIHDMIGEEYKLSKPTESFLHLFLVEIIKKIIEKSNDLLHPIDYENQSIKSFPNKNLTIRELETSILLLFPKEISQFIIKNCNCILCFKNS